MLVYAKVGHDRVNPPQIHAKLVKFPGNIFNYLFICYKYQQMNAQLKWHRLIIYAIYVPNVRDNIPGCLPPTPYGG